MIRTTTTENENPIEKLKREINQLRTYNKIDLPEVNPDDRLHTIVNADGKKRYFNQSGEQKKIVPRINKLFEQLFNRDGKPSHSISEDEKAEMIQKKKEQLKNEKRIDPHSSIYNYYKHQIYQLKNAYQEFVPEKIKKEFKSKMKWVQLWAYTLAIYSLFCLNTSFATWSKLTTNRSIRVFWFTFIGLKFYSSNQAFDRQINQSIFDYHQQWQKIIEMHEREHNINSLL